MRGGLSASASSQSGSATSGASACENSAKSSRGASCSCTQFTCLTTSTKKSTNAYTGGAAVPGAGGATVSTASAASQSASAACKYIDAADAILTRHIGASRISHGSDTTESAPLHRPVDAAYARRAGPTDATESAPTPLAHVRGNEASGSGVGERAWGASVLSEGSASPPPKPSVSSVRYAAPALLVRKNTGTKKYRP